MGQPRPAREDGRGKGEGLDAEAEREKEKITEEDPIETSNWMPSRERSCGGGGGGGVGGGGALDVGQIPRPTLGSARREIAPAFSLPPLLPAGKQQQILFGGLFCIAPLGFLVIY